MKDTFTQFIRLGLLILTFGMVLYWVECTWFAPARIVCEQDKLDAEGKGHICWHTLMQRYAPDKIIWIDARSEADYEKNRLAGTNAYPIRPGVQRDEFFLNVEERLFNATERGECIVVFCTASCTASDEISAYLRDEGGLDAPVYVLQGGWDTIKAENPDMLLVR